MCEIQEKTNTPAPHRAPATTTLLLCEKNWVGGKTVRLNFEIIILASNASLSIMLWQHGSWAISDTLVNVFFNASPVLAHAGGEIVWVFAGWLSINCTRNLSYNPNCERKTNEWMCLIDREWMLAYLLLPEYEFTSKGNGKLWIR